MIKEELKNNESNLFPTEKSAYSQRLREIENPTFESIRDEASKYVESIPNSNQIFTRLNRGTKILNNEEELFQYIYSYGTMHQMKLEWAFDKLIKRRNKKGTINIIDWSCGQALATCVFIDYIKDNELKFSISDIILIEPSESALSRGLLHVDVLKENEINIKAVNKDLDSLEESDLIFNNENMTLHLFSNILDIESFKLDKAFLKKISNSQNGLNYFLCISPNINATKNARLDMFYRYFSDNFKTELRSSEDSEIAGYTRYEKIFKVFNL